MNKFAVLVWQDLADVAVFEVGFWIERVLGAELVGGADDDDGDVVGAGSFGDELCACGGDEAAVGEDGVGA